MLKVVLCTKLHRRSNVHAIINAGDGWTELMFHFQYPDEKKRSLFTATPPGSTWYWY